jgi:CRP/FNR family transcriptional regulator, cyclic AMP receptor protein
MTPVARLRIATLFEDLTEAELEKIAQLCALRTYERDAQIMGEHDETDDVFFVLDGAVRVNSHASTGREVVFTEVSAGGMFGEFSAIDGLPRSATVIAMSHCLVARMSAEAFSSVLHANARVAYRLIEVLVSRIRRTTERFFEVSALAVRDRVHRELLRLATDSGLPGQGAVIAAAPTHYEFAVRIGTHREAVTREFNRLESAGIIEVKKRHIRILNMTQLRQFDDAP